MKVSPLMLACEKGGVRELPVLRSQPYRTEKAKIHGVPIGARQSSRAHACQPAERTNLSIEVARVLLFDVV